MSEDSTVRKVADYLEMYCYPEYSNDPDWAIKDAKAIVKIVHESEDSDE